MFLTAAELRQLTGYSRPSKQIAWLRENGWRFNVNAIGDPVVANAEASRQLVGGGVRAKIEQAPNFESLDGKAA